MHGTGTAGNGRDRQRDGVCGAFGAVSEVYWGSDVFYWESPPLLRGADNVTP